MTFQQHITEEELALVKRFLSKQTTHSRIPGLSAAVEKLLKNHEVLTEVWVDANQTAWTRPTPWAYAQNCKARDMYRERMIIAEEKVKMTNQVFTQDQLRAAFEIVKNKENWKLPIDIIIEWPGLENLRCLEQAVIHFTGSVPMVVSTPDGMKIHVTADGYYNAIGA